MSEQTLDRPGKYSHIVRWVHEQAKAKAAIVIIIGGSQGDGIDIAAPYLLQLQAPKILRNAANDLEAKGGALGPAPGQPTPLEMMEKLAAALKVFAVAHEGDHDEWGERSRAALELITQVLPPSPEQDPNKVVL